MANIYKSNYTGAQVDDAVKKVLAAAPAENDALQKKLKEGNNITIADDGTISATNPAPSVTIAANAIDDDVVILTGSGGTNSVSYDAKHAKKGPASGYTSGNTTTSISGSGASGIIKIPQITVDSYGHVTNAEDESVTITMPTNYSVVEITTSQTTLTNEQYNTLIASPFNKIKFNNKIYILQEENSTSYIYTSNDLNNDFQITIAKSTRAITVGSSSSLPITGGTLTGDLRLKDSTNYGRSLLFGDGSYAYINEDTDDHLTVYGNKGVTLKTTSTYPVKVTGGSSPLESTNGFKKTDFDNTYVLLAGGGAKLISELGGGGSGGTTLANGTTLYLHHITLVGNSGNIATFSFYSDKGSSYTGDLTAFKADLGAINNLIISDGSVIVNNTLYCILHVTVDSGLNVINVTYYNGSTSTNLTSWTSINDKVAKMAALGGDVTDVTFGGTGSALTVTNSNLSLVDGLHIRGKMPAAGIPSTIKLNNGTAKYVRTQLNGTPAQSLSQGMVVEFIYNTSISGGTWQIWGVDSLPDNDTHFTAGLLAGETGTITNSPTTNGHTYLKLTEKVSSSSTIVRSNTLIKGTGATTVTSNSNGDIIINSTDTNTDTKVTSVDNHYTPTANLTSEISKDASSTTEATWGSTSLVTGVNIQRDAKGHVTGMTLDSIKMPAKPETSSSGVTSLGGKTGAITLGSGLLISSDNVLSASGGSGSGSSKIYTLTIDTGGGDFPSGISGTLSATQLAALNSWNSDMDHSELIVALSVGSGTYVYLTLNYWYQSRDIRFSGTSTGTIYTCVLESTDVYGGASSYSNVTYTITKASDGTNSSSKSWGSLKALKDSSFDFKDMKFYINCDFTVHDYKTYKATFNDGSYLYYNSGPLKYYNSNSQDYTVWSGDSGNPGRFFTFPSGYGNGSILKLSSFSVDGTTVTDDIFTETLGFFFYPVGGSSSGGSTPTVSENVYTFSGSVGSGEDISLDTSVANLQDKQITGLWFHVGQSNDSSLTSYNYQLSLTDITMGCIINNSSAPTISEWTFNSGSQTLQFSIAGITQTYSNGTINYTFDIENIYIQGAASGSTPYVQFGFTYKGKDHAGSSMY